MPDVHFEQEHTWARLEGGWPCTWWGAGESYHAGYGDWMEVGTQYLNTYGGMRHFIKRGFLKVPTYLMSRVSRPHLYLYHGGYSYHNWWNIGMSENPPTYAGVNKGFQVFYSNWGPDLAEGTWDSVIAAATSPQIGPFSWDGLMATLEIPLINTGLINWGGYTKFLIKALDETTEPTYLGTLNKENFGSFFPAGLPCIGEPVSMMTQLSPGPHSTQSGVRGIGSRNR
jgi:hypothetical protein